MICGQIQEYRFSDQLSLFGIDQMNQTRAQVRTGIREQLNHEN